MGMGMGLVMGLGMGLGMRKKDYISMKKDWEGNKRRKNIVIEYI